MKKAFSRQSLKNVKRLIVKVGTSTLSHDNGKLNLRRMEILVRELVNLRNQGIEIVLVSSGAVGAGMGKLNAHQRPKTIPEKQALASIGQGLLMHIYEKLMSEYGQLVAQVLLTASDLDIRDRFLNARNTIMRLLEYGAIPIINENDSVAYSELKFGDNDTLAALVGVLIDADAVILLTDIDGLYDANPKENPEAKMIYEVDEITSELKRGAGDGGKFGTGGMITKIKAAEIATFSGIPLLIANGSEPETLYSILMGETIGTLFHPSLDRRGARKNWICFGSKAKGSVYIDHGAVEAITTKGKSLLPSGIVEVEGHFEVGDIVEIRCLNKNVLIARGMTSYGSHDIARIKGHHTTEIQEILGYKDFDEVIHRDNMGVILEGTGECS